MQLARAEVLDDCSVLLHPELPLFTVGGVNPSSCNNIVPSKNKVKDFNHTVAIFESLCSTKEHKRAYMHGFKTP